MQALFLTLRVSIGIFVCQIVFAATPVAEKFYGAEFINAYESGSLKNKELIDSLHKIIAKPHHSLGYDKARQHLFGKIALEQVGGAWAIKDVYCEHTFTKHEVDLGPGVVPSADHLNTEHTWPQSRFTNRFPKDVQKSDLHHLYPTDSKMNSARGNMRFGEVVEDIETLKCPIAQLGLNKEHELVFEVPEKHKGNAARAIFYFATRYQMQISDIEESYLKRWNQIDPVDADEVSRNDQIEKLQGNRNPFIDFPEMLNNISGF